MTSERGPPRTSKVSKRLEGLARGESMEQVKFLTEEIGLDVGMLGIPLLLMSAAPALQVAKVKP